jgi:hypothetical protein
MWRVRADREAFFGVAVVDEKEPDKANQYIEGVVAQDPHNGIRTRHQDQCPSVVSFRTANPTQSNPAKYKPGNWICCCPILMPLFGDNT